MRIVPSDVRSLGGHESQGTISTSVYIYEAARMSVPFLEAKCWLGTYVIGDPVTAD